jgi:hypothetical protein
MKMCIWILSRRSIYWGGSHLSLRLYMIKRDFFGKEGKGLYGKKAWRKGMVFNMGFILRAG